MPEDEQKKNKASRVSDSERFRYIGFDVYPGKPKDLFKSDQEKAKLVEAVAAKRSQGQVIREQCTLLEERVSASDRIILGLACLVILASLFIPWYSAYNEVVEETAITGAAVLPSDSVATAATGGDSALIAAGQNSDTTSEAIATSTKEPIEAGAAEGQSPEALTTAGEQGQGDSSAAEAGGSSEEIIHGMKARKKIYRQYSRLSGIGAFLTLGRIGSYVFSSGFVLKLTAILLMLFGLLCVVLPLYTLYGVFRLKGSPDERALKLKKILRLNWIPVVAFVTAFILSFFGADYSFDAATFYGSLGSNYGVGVFLDSLSWGIFVSLAAFVLAAVKGIEI